jgi:hypothetical protein
MLMVWTLKAHWIADKLQSEVIYVLQLAPRSACLCRSACRLPPPSPGGHRRPTRPCGLLRVCPSLYLVLRMPGDHGAETVADEDPVETARSRRIGNTTDTAIIDGISTLRDLLNQPSL